MNENISGKGDMIFQKRSLNNVAIAIIAFDGYVDLWDDCIRLIKKYWQPHPKIYLFTNEIVKNYEDVTCIPVGKNAEWSIKAQEVVKVLKEKYIILFLEDFYIGDIVDNDVVTQTIDFMQKKDIKYLKICNNNSIIKKRRKIFSIGFPYEIIYANEEYGISLQPAIWNKEFLQEELGTENYNAWVFEVMEIKKANKSKREILHNAVFDPRNILNIRHGVLQGKMLPNTVRYFNKKGEVLSNNRSVMPLQEYLFFILKTICNDLTPKIALKMVKNIAKKFGYISIEDKWAKKL